MSTARRLSAADAIAADRIVVNRAVESTTIPPKVHAPGKRAPNPQPVEGGSPFEPGRVRGDLTLRA